MDRITKLKIDKILNDQQQVLQQIQQLATQLGAVAERGTLLWLQYADLEDDPADVAATGATFAVEANAMLDSAAEHIAKAVYHVSLGTGLSVAQVIEAITPAVPE